MNRSFAFGMIFGILAMGCAGAKFGFKFYTLAPASFEGKLQGPKPEDDEDLRTCAPTSADKAPCVVMYTSDFLRLRQDYLDTKTKLETCERDSN